MQRRVVAVLILAVILAAAPTLAATTYGKGVTVTEVTPISALLDKPEAWSGRTLAVKGLVVDVCQARGCWMELAGDQPYQKLRIKVEDGQIVFPMTARGKVATVQGTLERIPMCPDEAQKFRQKEALAKGVAFDPKTVTGRESYLTIRATGAVVD